MKIYWICALFLFSTVCAELSEFDIYDDYYDSLEDMSLEIKDEPNNEKTDIENDLKVQEEIQQFINTDDKENDDSIEDYQVEDNRDKDKDNLENIDNEGILEDNNENRPEDIENADYSLLRGDDNIAPLPVPDINDDDEGVQNDDAVDEAIIEETQKILDQEDADKFDDNETQKAEEVDSGFDDDIDNQNIIEETEKILNEPEAEKFEDEIKPDDNDEIKKSEETNNEFDDLSDELVNEDQENLHKVLVDFDNFFDENDFNDMNEALDDAKPDANDQNDVKEEKKVASEEDTVDKAYEDLNADLEKLFETLDKLKDNSDNVSDEKLEEDFNKLLGEWDTDLESKIDQDEEHPIDFDKLLEDIRNENDFKEDNFAGEISDLNDLELNKSNPREDNPFDETNNQYNLEEINADTFDLKDDELNKNNPEDDQEEDVETINVELGRIIFGDDAFIDKVENAENDETELKDDADSVEEEVIEIEFDPENDEQKETTPKFKTAAVDDLSSSELNDLVSQFAVIRSDDIDVNSETFAEKNTAPIHITLKLDEPTVITSPDYPSPYPTNNVVDWIITGDGEGIELNVTDFAVNGALGDFLLIKPGGIDDSGHDGILFTYRLNSERLYRFTDVDRVFMRFESKLGMMFFRGFSISAKMIAPHTDTQEEIPEPEAVVTPPHSTSTLHLGTTVPRFHEVEEQFRALLANMAAEYIRENDIDPGLNATSEVTQITSVHLCPVSWPNFEECVAVTFGVSLEYEEEDEPRLNEDDLVAMWAQYSREEPFASTLEKLGLSEFVQPNAAALTAWLLVAGGVLAMMALIAAVLWRYSCFEDYTRMNAYSDTDSLQNEKRNLDLYPTPHQTLPPLYSDTDYKWREDSTRVDMGGYANRSYASDNMYDFESDEDVIATRERNGAANAKDTFKV